MKFYLSALFASITLWASAQDELAMAEQLYDDGLYESVVEYLHSFEIRHAKDLMLEADAHHKMKDYEAAVETYTQVIARDEDNATAMMRRGAAYLELGEFSFALGDLRKTLKKFPESPEGNFYMGNICYDQDDMRGAVKYYEKAIRYRPGYLKATYMLGAAQSELGRGTEAARSFATVLDEMPEARYNLAVVKLESELYDQALDIFNALEKSPAQRTPDLYFFRAESHFFSGNKHEACADYQRAADLGDEEALEIYDGYCMKSRKKPKRDKRDTIYMAF